MRDLFRFLTIVISVIFAVFLVWNGLRFYAHSKAPPTYQTELVKQLSTMVPMAVEPWPADSKALSLQIHYGEGQWRVFGDDKKSETLANILLQRPRAIFFIEPRVDDTSNLATLKEILTTNNIWQRVVLYSRADGILRDLRKLAPQWTFSSGEIFLTKLLSLHSLGLAGLTEIPGDILFVSNQGDVSKDEERDLEAFAKHQHKLILVQNKNEPDQLELK